MINLVLLRHGQSEWNLSNQFTGWADVSLTQKGVEEAISAGQALKSFVFDKAYCSILSRAKKTLEIVLKNRTQIPTVYDKRLNERHYGALQGLNKKDTAEKYGENQVKIWRRSFDTPPPALEDNDPRLIEVAEALNIPVNEVPRTESLKDCINRLLPLWNEIATEIKIGKRVIIVAHGNSLRALVKYLDDMSNEDIMSVEIPTGVPLVYELNADLKPSRHYYLNG